MNRWMHSFAHAHTYFVTLSTKSYYVYLVVLRFRKTVDVCNGINNGDAP